MTETPENINDVDHVKDEPTPENKPDANEVKNIINESITKEYKTIIAEMVKKEIESNKNAIDEEIKKMLKNNSIETNQIPESDADASQAEEELNLEEFK